MPAAPGEQQLPRPQEVFISYSRKDKEFVRRLHEALSQRNREAWVDWEDIRPTEEFMQAIYGAIEGADTFIFVLTPDSVALPSMTKTTCLKDEIEDFVSLIDTAAGLLRRIRPCAPAKLNAGL
jgi:TIR domain